MYGWPPLLTYRFFALLKKQVKEVASSNQHYYTQKMTPRAFQTKVTGILGTFGF